MAITIEDVRKAVATIKNYCDEFETNYPTRMEPLKGEEIVLLSNDRETIQRMRIHLDRLNRSIGDLSHKA